MKLNNLSLAIILTVSIGFLVGCSTMPEKEEETSSDKLVQISNEQFASEQMQVGNSATHSFTKGLKTTGIVSASPQSKADLYSYIPGIIKSISVNIGSYVRKGQVLCTIESKEFIKLQQQYLVSLAQVKATQSNYQRVKQLYDEKIASQKDFLAIESEYNMLNASIGALKAELKILNVNLKKLEGGNLSTYLPILSPIDGSITMLDGNIGQFVDSQKLLMRIVDNKDLQLHFFVYQESIYKLKLGQSLSFYNPDNAGDIYKAEIISIGKSINPETKSVECIAKLEDKNTQKLVNGMYFQVDIIIDTYSTKAISSTAIFQSGKKHYVLVKEKQDGNNLFFRQEEIEIGISANGFTEIKGEKSLDDILIKGAYYFQ